ncbi:hypothetical protein [Staphylococcus haemolyticus]|uniref:hypothetical protein n=1 Tax=Staphylococcus haemolyticus TaxID=1283 RepID=UPI001F0A736E|nr:hypothetical protein [Staphylococcus haemolyticus]MCH4334924.1 hypothetical protein [Staphylococcus haemolyticus]
MSTNIDLLTRMLNKEGYKYSSMVDEIEIKLNNNIVFIKDDETAYEITYKGNFDVAHDEMELLGIIESYK